MNRKRGFTLIELLVTISILGVLAALIAGNFITSLKKGRDARRKTDLEQIQKAVEMYYEDKKAYPTFTFPFGSKLCETVNCVSGEKVYMQKVSNDPISGNTYVYQSSGTDYQLYSCIENSLDQGPGVNQSPGYSGKNCGSGVCNPCKYGISSPNTTP